MVDKSIVIDMHGCARCGAERHEGMRFFAFERNTVRIEHVEFTHWALCPVLREPIMYRPHGMAF